MIMLDKFAFTRGMVESHFPAIQFEFMQSHFGLDFGLVGKGNAAGMTIELFLRKRWEAWLRLFDVIIMLLAVDSL